MAALFGRLRPMHGEFIQSAFIKASPAKDAGEKDQALDNTLRPQTLSDFVGQDAALERLHVLMGAAKKRGEPLGHCLFHGPPGVGKTTLAHVIAKTMGTNLTVTSG